uniref:Secreted protein n=1 Tax=Eutreptiella gymnastica TaxID=73025 RepID=A0A7S4D3P2_9EUGL
MIFRCIYIWWTANSGIAAGCFAPHRPPPVSLKTDTPWSSLLGAFSECCLSTFAKFPNGLCVILLMNPFTIGLQSSISIQRPHAIPWTFMVNFLMVQATDVRGAGIKANACSG